MYAHAQSPVRIGLAGGGTDLPAWTSSGRTGRCLSLAIKAYTHAVAIARPDGLVVASYRDRVEAPAATEIANGLVRESALLHGWEEGFEVHTLSELSSRGTGLGVSSSIAVSLAACFQRLAALRSGDARRGLESKLDSGRMLAAKDAWTVEIDRLHRPIGRQDHMAAAFGGLRLYKFEGTDAVVEQTFTGADADWIAQHVLLVKLPEGHDSRALLTRAKDVSAISNAAAAVEIGVQAIERRNVADLGRALGRGQAFKNEVTGAVPTEVGAVLDKLKSVPGVHGCKIAGAGGGGHILVACESGLTKAVESATGLPTFTILPDFDGVRSDGWK